MSLASSTLPSGFFSFTRKTSKAEKSEPFLHMQYILVLKEILDIIETQVAETTGDNRASWLSRQRFVRAGAPSSASTSKNPSHHGLFEGFERFTSGVSLGARDGRGELTFLGRGATIVPVPCKNFIHWSILSDWNLLLLEICQMIQWMTDRLQAHDRLKRG